MLLYLWAQCLPTSPCCAGISVWMLNLPPKGADKIWRGSSLDIFTADASLGPGTFGISALCVPAVSNPGDFCCSSFPLPVTPLKTQLLSSLPQMDSPKRFGRCLLDSPPR